jgi:hypothetical protein
VNERLHLENLSPLVRHSSLAYRIGLRVNWNDPKSITADRRR